MKQIRLYYNGQLCILDIKIILDKNGGTLDYLIRRA